jgi:hypothetical protein
LYKPAHVPAFLRTQANPLCTTLMKVEQVVSDAKAAF